MRLALLTEIPAPFRIPLFNALVASASTCACSSSRSAIRGAALRAAPGRVALRRARAARRAAAARRRAGSCSTAASLRELRRFRPDAVAVGGWNQPAFWQALAYCAGCGASRSSSGSRAPLATRARRRARSRSRRARDRARRAARSSPGARPPSTRARSASSSSRSRRTRSTPDLRRARGRSPERDGCTFLYVGRLDPEKGLDMLLEAFRGVPGELVLVGGGSRRGAAARRGGRARALHRPARPRRARRVLPRRRRLRPAVALGAVGDGAERGGGGRARRSSRPRRPAPRTSSSRTASTASSSRRTTSPRCATRCGGSPPTRRCGRARRRSRELVAPLTPEAWAAGVASAAGRARGDELVVAELRVVGAGQLDGVARRTACPTRSARPAAAARRSRASAACGSRTCRRRRPCPGSPRRAPTRSRARPRAAARRSTEPGRRARAGRVASRSGCVRGRVHQRPGRRAHVGEVHEHLRVHDVVAVPVPELRLDRGTSSRVRVPDVERAKRRAQVQVAVRHRERARVQRDPREDLVEVVARVAELRQERALAALGRVAVLVTVALRSGAGPRRRPRRRARSRRTRSRSR